METAKKRDETQGTVTVSLSKDLIKVMDEYCRAHDMTRSQFFRATLSEALVARGVKISAEEIAPPSRLGKGGQPTHKRIRVELNETPHRYAKPGKTTSSGSRAGIKPKAA